MIIDDSEAIIKQVAYLLKKNDFEVGFLLESSFVEERLEYEPVDLIILDVFMPGIDGISTLKKIKSNKKFKSIPVIMLTSDTNDALLEECFSLGASDFLNKPVKEQVLLTRVKNSLSNSIYLREIESKSLELEKSQNLITSLYKKILKELEEARITQHSMVALDFPKISGCEMTSFFKPVEQVGGDFISYEVVNDDRIDILFADVSGHGISSAMISCMSILAFKSAATRNNTPSDALRYMNNLLYGTVNNRHYVVGVYLIYNPYTLELSYSYAGHHPMILIRDEEVQELVGSGTGILMFKDTVLENYKFKLEPNDKLMLYSDGAVEIFGYKNTMFGFDGIKNSILKHKSFKGKDFLESIFMDMIEFSEKELKDDISMFLLEVH